jgi:hypothetical protein
MKLQIRKISGAMIHISKREGGITDRTIKITGKPEAVALAQCVINMSVKLKKVTLEVQNPATAEGPGTSNPGPSSSGSSSADASRLPNIIRFAQLMAKPGALKALTSLSALETRNFWKARAPQLLSRPRMFTVHTRPIPPGCGARVEVWAHKIRNVIGPSLRLTRINHNRPIILV